MKKSLFIIAIIAIIIGVLYFLSKKETIAPAVVLPIVTDTNLAEKVNVENYLRTNISKLSPVKAVLGGTWYVVSDTVDLVKNSGTIVYEDGHIQEVKNFSYITNEKGEIVSLTIVDPINRIAGGYVAGHVTIGPFCPVERVGVPCPVPEQAYTSRQAVVYYSDGVTVKDKMTLDKKGNYKFALGPGKYFAQIVLEDIGSGEKKPFTVVSLQTATVDFNIDTGIR